MDSMRQSIRRIKNARSVVKIGNALGIILPSEFTKATELTGEDSVEMWIDGDELVVKPVYKPVNIRDLFASYDGKYRGEELAWGEDVGGETLCD